MPGAGGYALSGLLLVCLLASPVFSSVLADYTPVGPGDTYLALGDSLATGTEHEANEDGEPGYPAVLYNRLQADYPDLNYSNLARAEGETSTSMITSTGTLSSQLELAIAFIEEERAAGRRVGLVTLSIGGNDMFSILPEAVGGENRPGEEVLAEFESNLAIILDRLLAALTVDGERQGDLLIANAYNPYPGLQNPFDPTDTTDVWVPRLNEVISRTATLRDVPVADIATAFEGNGEAYTYVEYPIVLGIPINEADFDLHPRPAGHAAIAEQFLRASQYAVDTTDPSDRRVYLPLVQR
jgi:lysophospholipase L1-like esterase